MEGQLRDVEPEKGWRERHKWSKGGWRAKHVKGTYSMKEGLNQKNTEEEKMKGKTSHRILSNTVFLKEWLSRYPGVIALIHQQSFFSPGVLKLSERSMV